MSFTPFFYFMNITINPIYYKNVHGDIPKRGKRDWKIKPPRNGQAWIFEDMTYKQAEKALKEQAAKNVGEGVYWLLP